MNKKITSSALAALMIAGSTSFSALAAMANGTVVIGTKAFDMAYANDPKNADEIGNAIVAGGAVYVKDFEGNWIDNNTTKKVEASVIPAVTYKNATGVVTEFAAADKDAMVGAVAVSAISARSFKVAFNSAVEDTTKVVFTVKGSSGTVVATTATWNTAKTEATLTSSYNMTADTYSVGVVNDTKDLGTSTVKITQQEVAKIQITSTVLSVVPGVYSSSTPNAGKGFASYKVLDQYGNDITSTPLGNNITWTIGIGTVNTSLTKNGVLVIDPYNGSTLNTYANSTAVISGYDTNNYVTTSSSLTISMSTGTISQITLNELTSPNKDDFNSASITGQWYLDYTALDASGNATTNFTLIDSGILQVNGGAFLTCAIVKDPTDSSKAAISVKVNQTYASTLTTDTQIPITILTTNGKSSTKTVTLKKAAALSSFTISAPTNMVASGETVEIPFTAFDQNGVAITSYSKLKTYVNLSLTGGSLVLLQNADGSARLQATLPTVVSGLNSMTTYLMANVIATGKTSQITLNVQKVAQANELTLDSSVVIPVMQKGSSQGIDFGYTYGGLTVKDQYGRDMDMTGSAGNYRVIATTSSAISALTLSGTASGANAISIAASNTVGTQTVNFQLVNVNSPSTVIDQKSITFTVVDNADITGYSINTLALQYAQRDPSLAKAIDADYKKTAKVYGSLSNGNKVLLASKFVLNGVTKDTVVTSTVDSADFTVAPSSASGYTTGTKTAVYANKYTSSTQTTGSANVNVMVNGTDGLLHTLTTKATSSNAALIAKSISYYADTTVSGVTDKNNIVTVNRADVDGQSMIYAAANGTETSSPVYFIGTDQYGTDCAPLTVYIAQQTGSATINSTTGVLTLNGSGANTIVLTAVTANGLSKTITIQVQ